MFQSRKIQILCSQRVAHLAFGVDYMHIEQFPDYSRFSRGCYSRCSGTCDGSGG
jgi:hypothetical protein